jgi:hypothetical protein
VKVTFVKKERHYAIHVHRDRAPDLWMDPAPGYDDHLPHDLLHFVAEEEFGLDGGVFGDLATGGNARIFIPVDPKETAKLWREMRRKKVRLPDGRRSEQLADQLERGWRARTLEPELQAKLDALAAQWHALQVGGELTLEWPDGRRRRSVSLAARRRVTRRSQR